MPKQDPKLALTKQPSPQPSQLSPDSVDPPKILLPPAELLQGYDRLRPGLGAEIADAFSAEFGHRRAAQMKALDAEIEDARASRKERARGQFCGLIIGIVALVGGVMTVSQGHDFAGGVIGGGGVLGLVTVFVKGRND